MASEEVQRCRSLFLQTLGEMNYPYDTFWEIVRKLGEANPCNKETLRIRDMMLGGADAMTIWRELKIICDEKARRRELRKQRELEKAAAAKKSK